MKQSLTSRDTRWAAEIQEDFELIDPADCNEPFKFFQKMIRTKHFRRIVREADQKAFIENGEEMFTFEVVKDQRDHYEVYRANYAELASFVQLVDFTLLENLKIKLRTSFLADIDRKERKEQSQKLGHSYDIETMIEEFKLLIDVLADLYCRGELYNLMDAENNNKICKFGVKHSQMQDIMVSFFLSKLFGSFNKVSSKLIHDFVLALASRAVNINISTWAILLPEFEFFNIKTWIGQKVESLVFSRLFKRQREQIKFLFTKLNQMVHEHINELEETMQLLFSSPDPVDYQSYEVYFEVLNAKYEEINTIKFPSEKDKQLNINDICRIADIDFNKEVESIKVEQIIADMDYDMLDDQELEVSTGITVSTQEKPNTIEESKSAFYRSMDCNITRERRGFVVLGDRADAKYDSVNNFQLIEFADSDKYS